MSERTNNKRIGDSEFKGFVTAKLQDIDVVLKDIKYFMTDQRRNVLRLDGRIDRIERKVSYFAGVASVMGAFFGWLAYQITRFFGGR